QSTRQLRTAQLDEEIHQAGVSILVELEQRFVHRPAVCAGCIQDPAGFTDSIAKPIFTEDLFGFGHKVQIHADALTRNEEPLAHSSLTFNGTQTASERHVMLRTVFVRATELEPCITGPIRITAHEKVPLDLL